MADSKVTALSALTDAVSGDLFYIVDVSDTTDDPAGSSKQISLSNLLKPYCVTGSGVNLTTTEATMDLSSEVVSNANYSLATDQITFTAAGTYFITYGVQVLEDGTGGAARSATTFHFENGVTPITQSEMSCYNRETSGPSGASTSFMVALSASDVLQLRGFVDYTATTDVSQGPTTVTILRVG